MKYLQKFDIYGEKFTFLLCQHYKFHSILSSVLSMTVFFVSIFYSYYFCSDFFKRENPKTLISTITRESAYTFNLTYDKFIAAWRIEDGLGNELHGEKYVYPVLFYFNSSSGEYEVVESKRCLEINLSSNVPDDFRDYYCFYWNDRLFGGNWDQELLFYFSFGLYFCENGDNFGEKSKCTNKKEVMNFFNSQLTYLTFYLPHINFLPEVKEKPFQIRYHKFFNLITPELQRVDKIKLHQVVINDDKNFFFSSNGNYTEWSSTSFETYYYFSSYSNYGTEGVSSNIYTLNFYLDEEYTYYKRWYMKISEALSILSTYVKITYVALMAFNEICNRSLMLSKLAGYYFEFPEEKKTIQRTKTSIIQSRNNYSSMITDISKVNLQKMNSFMSFKKSPSSKILFNLNKSTSASLTENNRTKSKKSKSMEFLGCCFIFKNMVCRSDKDKIKRCLLNKSFSLLKHKLDVVWYLDKQREFETVKKCIFNDKQCKAFQFLKKEKIEINDKKEDRAQDAKEVYEYYRMNNHNNNLIDKEICNKLIPSFV